MNGKDLLQAMSHVEERFVHEADFTPVRTKRPWLRVFAVAASFALLFTAAGFLLPKISSDNTRENLSMKGLYYNSEAEPEAGLAETVLEIVTENVLGDSEQPARVVYDVVLCVESAYQGGFTATVEKIVDTEVIPVGTEVTVRYSANIIMIENDGELVSCTREAPRQTDLPAGSVVKVRFTLTEDGVLLVSQIGKENAF